MICPWEKVGKGGVAPFISSASSRCSFVFALSQFCEPDYLGAWNRLITAEFERVHHLFLHKLHECKFGCLVAPPTDSSPGKYFTLTS